MRKFEHELVESGAGAPPLGSGGDSGAFAPGLSPAPIGTFPAPALRTRRADFRHRALQWDHASRTRIAVAIRACSWPGLRPRLRALHGVRSASRLETGEPASLFTPRRHRNLDGSTPSLMHVMFPESLPLTRDLRQRHSRRPSSFQHPSTPEAPFLDRHYPVSSVVRASPPPWRPGLPLTGFRLTRARHRQGFPCCSHPPLPCVPPPIPRRDRPVRSSLTSRPVAAFPNVRVGRLPHSRFRGLLSVHSRCGPHGRWITLGDPFHRSASNDVVTSIIRSDCYRLERQFAGRDSHPLRDGAFPRHTVRNQEIYSIIRMGIICDSAHRGAQPPITDRPWGWRDRRRNQWLYQSTSRLAPSNYCSGRVFQ